MERRKPSRYSLFMLTSYILLQEEWNEALLVTTDGILCMKESNCNSQLLVSRMLSHLALLINLMACTRFNSACLRCRRLWRLGKEDVIHSIS